MKISEKKGTLTIVDFNELDACKIASKIERDGITFYQNLIEKVADTGARERLCFLLGEEKKHLAFFEEWLNQAAQTREDNFEEDDLLSYMDYGIFQPYQRMGEMKDLIDDVAKALDLGVIIEDRTVKFYEACKEKVSSKKTKKQLGDIIAEEEKHKALLEALIASQ